MTAIQQEQREAARVLSFALENTRVMLGLSHDQVARTIGVDRSSISRLGTKTFIDPESKSGELALMLICVYRSLFALVGNSPENMTHWMHTENLHLAYSPSALIQSEQGLQKVFEYLEAIRCKQI